MTRVLVCGGRDFSDYGYLRAVMDRCLKKRGVAALIHGDATGADACAAFWASQNKLLTEGYPADWHAHGRGAGPIRNQRMLDEGKPDLVIAFPGGRGTADMVARARKAGVEVIEIPSPTHQTGES